MLDLDDLVVDMVEWMDGPGRCAAGPRLVRVDAVPGEPGIERVASAPLCAGLLGWVAPPGCRAVGVIARGRAWTLSDTERLPPGRPDGPLADGVSVAVMVDRLGMVAARVQLPDRPPLGEVPQGGQLLDCLQRSLGLPTMPPPGRAALYLHLSLWLDAVRAEAERLDRPLTWREVVGQHPGGRILIASGADRTPEAVIDATEVAASALDWESLRLRTVSGPLAGQLLPADLASWMDAGMFARWVTDELSDPYRLADQLEPMLARSTAQRLQRVLGAWR